MGETDSDRTPIENESEYRERANELQAYGGLPPGRAEVVALRERGLTYQQIGDRLGMTRQAAGSQVNRYKKEDRPEAEWLLEHGPDLP